METSSGRPLGFAVVGLGHIAQSAVLPAFANSDGMARLVALVSSDPLKLAEVGERYGVDPSLRFAEEDLGDCLRHEKVEAVYIALPNSQHADVTVRASRAGVHVLCEKPMATSVGDCRRMIEACEDAGVVLSIAYRLHFDPSNLRAVELLRREKIGEARLFTSEFSYQVAAGNVRTSVELGGGPMWDLGVYCINAARYLFGDEPEEVVGLGDAGEGDDRFREVERSFSAILRFPRDRLASFTVSFGTAESDGYRVLGSKGTLELQPAYSYGVERKLSITVGEDTKTESFKPSDQFAPELIRFTEAVEGKRPPQPGGREGLADVRVVSALFASARQGRSLFLSDFDPGFRPLPEQGMEKPPSQSRGETHVQAPHG